ncbi:MAG: KOW domain-containing RNA-binding protein [Eubacterium sp.]|nr:KOW domain-containing RNA-binding protein [Eubacterium sp.]
MKQLERGMYARSLAGHDKGRLYIVLKCEDKYVILVDGVNKTLAHPKKKKRMHVQPVYQLSKIIAEQDSCRQALTDQDIKKALIEAGGK